MHALITELKWYQQHDTDDHSVFPTAPAKEWEEARDIEWEQFTELVDTWESLSTDFRRLSRDSTPVEGELRTLATRATMVRKFARAADGGCTNETQLLGTTARL